MLCVQNVFAYYNFQSRMWSYMWIDENGMRTQQDRHSACEFLKFHMEPGTVPCEIRVHILDIRGEEKQLQEVII